MSEQRSRADQSLIPTKEIPQRDLTLRVSGRELGEGQLLELRQPFAVIGRAASADISLRSSKLSFRHAYLQVLDGQVFCLDLKSQTGLSWGGRRRSCGWLSATNSVRIGPYRLRLSDEKLNDAAVSTHEPPPNPLKELVRPELFSQYCVEFFDDSIPDPIRSIDRRITLIGRDANCALHLDDSSVSRVHCALVLERDGLWVVDLLGKGGILLDGKRVQIQRVQSGSELVVGTHTMAFWLRDPNSHGSASEELNENKTADVVEDHELGGLAEWRGTLFAIEHQKDALVVMPMIRSGMFRYEKLQIELNALRFKLLQSGTPNLVLDLSRLHYTGAEVMRAVVSLARHAESRAGQIAFCSANGHLESIFKRMGLFRIWTLYPTREAALAAFHQESTRAATQID